MQTQKIYKIIHRFIMNKLISFHLISKVRKSENSKFIPKCKVFLSSVLICVPKKYFTTRSFTSSLYPNVRYKATA